jgi:hypothetical protein
LSDAPDPCWTIRARVSSWVIDERTTEEERFMKTRKATRWHVAVGAALAVITSGAAVALDSPAAQATACVSPVPRNADNNRDTVTGAGQIGLALRAVPDTSCALRDRIPNGTVLDLWCYAYGDDVAGIPTWSYVDYRGTRGWVSDYYLRNGGSTATCADH